MDSNSDSGDTFFKLEPDSDNESYVNMSKVEPRLQWSSESTVKLIDTMERDCKELWDAKHPMNKDRAARQAKLQYLALMFGTTVEEISRKIHNLRTQFNNELRKIKKRQYGEERGAAASGWEYFDALCFLRSPHNPLDVDHVDGVNLALAEFQAKEEMEFGAALRANSNKASSPTEAPKPTRVAASAPLPLPPSANPLMWPEEPAPRLRPGMNADECQPRFASISPLLERLPFYLQANPNKASSHTGAPKPTRVAASAPLPLPPSANPLMWPEEPAPRLRPGMNADECQIFGDFVASELRTLRSDDARKKLKRIIQKAILQIGEEKDGNGP